MAAAKNSGQTSLLDREEDGHSDNGRQLSYVDGSQRERSPRSPQQARAAIQSHNVQYPTLLAPNSHDRTFSVILRQKSPRGSHRSDVQDLSSSSYASLGTSVRSRVTPAAGPPFREFRSSEIGSGSLHPTAPEIPDTDILDPSWHQEGTANPAFSAQANSNPSTRFGVRAPSMAAISAAVAPPHQQQPLHIPVHERFDAEAALANPYDADLGTAENMPVPTHLHDYRYESSTVHRVLSGVANGDMHHFPSGLASPLPPSGTERTTSQVVRDQLNSEADRQVQYILDAPFFREDLRDKLISVRP
jgi:hypothetical protein